MLAHIIQVVKSRDISLTWHNGCSHRGAEGQHKDDHNSAYGPQTKWAGYPDKLLKIVQKTMKNMIPNSFKDI